MNLTFLFISLLFLFTFSAHSYFPQGTLKVVPPENPESLEDFAHPHKGCPENSDCDEKMGGQLLTFKTLVKELEAEEDFKLKIKKLEAYRSQFGLPVEFYTTQKADQNFKPLFYNSPCKNHNPKNKENQTLLGVAFIKKISQGKGHIQRGDTLYEIPIGELFQPQPVEVFFDQKKPSLFYLPTGDKPLLIKDQGLIVLKEEDGFFYPLKISPNGEWLVSDFDLKDVTKWYEKTLHGSCPESTTKAPDAFGTFYCEHIWSEDLKKNIPVKYYRGCVL